MGSRVSFENIEKKWYPEISHHWQNPKVKVPCILVGLKSDLRNDVEAMKELSKKNCEPISKEEVGYHGCVKCRRRSWRSASTPTATWSAVRRRRMVSRKGSIVRSRSH